MVRCCTDNYPWSTGIITASKGELISVVQKDRCYVSRGTVISEIALPNNPGNLSYAIQRGTMCSTSRRIICTTTAWIVILYEKYYPIMLNFFSLYCIVKNSQSGVKINIRDVYYLVDNHIKKKNSVDRTEVI